MAISNKVLFGGGASELIITAAAFSASNIDNGGGSTNYVVAGDVGATYTLTGSAGASSPGAITLDSSPKTTAVSIGGNSGCGAGGRSPQIVIAGTGDTILAGGLGTDTISQAAGPPNWSCNHGVSISASKTSGGCTSGQHDAGSVFSGSCSVSSSPSGCNYWTQVTIYNSSGTASGSVNCSGCSSVVSNWIMYLHPAWVSGCADGGISWTYTLSAATTNVTFNASSWCCPSFGSMSCCSSSNGYGGVNFNGC